MNDFSYYVLEFEHEDEFAIEYESFLMDNEPECDVFDFDDACYVDLIVDIVSTCDTFAVPLDLNPLPDSLKYAFYGS